MLDQQLLKYIFRYKTFLFQGPANGVKDLVISWSFSSHRITWVFHSQNQSSCTLIIERWRSEAWGIKNTDITRLFYGEKGTNYCEKICVHWSFQCAFVCKDSQICIYFNNIIIFKNTKLLSTSSLFSILLGVSENPWIFM